MKRFNLIFKILLLAAMVAVISAGYSGRVVSAASGDWMEKSTQLPDSSSGQFSNTFRGYLRPEMRETTCSKAIAGANAGNYYFGFKRNDGYCSTMAVFANNREEAWSCAREYCPDCSGIEDITGQVKEKPALFGENSLNGYCPAR